MRILIVLTRGDTIGGAQKHVLDLSSLLVGDGFEVLVVCGGEAKELESQLVERGVALLKIPEFDNSFNIISDLHSVFGLYKIVLKWKPDVLSLHSTKSSLLFRFVGYFLKITTIVTVHGWSFSEGVGKYRQILMRFLEKVFSFSVDCFIVVSKYDFDLALSKKICSKSKLKLIYNGSDLPSQWKNSFRTEGLILTMVARFDQQKNQLELMNACADFDNLTINFVGDGPTRKVLESCYKSGDFQCKVNFLGFRRDVSAVLLDSDLFALISNWEGFPISTIEAMSYGLPVLVSNVGGASECVLNGENGFIIEKGDLATLKIILARIISNPGILPKMGLRSREVFVARYTITEFYTKTRDLFLELIN
jgi:glycosyltransferase involved in cell wall biosynthesis